MIVGSYQYDFNDPDEHNNVVGLRAFDRDHNSFILDLAQIQFYRSPGEDGGVGFMIKLNFGKTAERMASDWDGDGTIGNVSEEDNSVELEEAYITYNFPGLPALQLKGGKFVTLLGAEVIESPKNLNVSRSLAYTFAIPIGHTGLLMSYAFAPEFTVIGGAVNGWDNVVDSNDGKTFLGGVILAPAELISIALTGVYGAEQPDREGSHRGVGDLVVTIKPVDILTISLNYDYGNESDLGPDRDDTAEWNAASGIVALDFVDLPLPIGFAVRGEYFDDSDGARLGPTFGDYQNAWEVTGTFKIVLDEGLMARAEYRYDNVESEQPALPARRRRRPGGSAHGRRRAVVRVWPGAPPASGSAAGATAAGSSSSPSATADRATRRLSSRLLHLGGEEGSSSPPIRFARACPGRFQQLNRRRRRPYSGSSSSEGGARRRAPAPSATPDTSASSRSFPRPTGSSGSRTASPPGC